MGVKKTKKGRERGDELDSGSLGLNSHHDSGLPIKQRDREVV